MANFKGHLGTAAALGAVAASAGYYIGHLEPGTAATCFLIACVGGLTPDIDSDNSHSIRIIFNIIAGAILIIFTLLEFVHFGIAAALIFRYVLIWPFRKLSDHRGIWHSVPMAFALGMLIYVIAKHLNDPAAVWYGKFFILGFLIHLIVDEIFAYGKRSQWTALKLWSNKNAVGYLFLYCATPILWILTV